MPYPPSCAFEEKYFVQNRRKEFGKSTGCLSISVTHLGINISANIRDIALYFSRFVDNTITF